MEVRIADLRRDYSSQTLLEANVAAHPVEQFERWWQQAVDSQIIEPNAMTLATASPDGMPAARIVLLKGFSKNGFVFFTNYESYKGLQLKDNPKACLVFFWKELERQVRITGLAKKLDSKDSDAYFHSRPKGSRLGAVVSPQSQVIESRTWMDEQFTRIAKEYAIKDPQRPEHWGGYVVQPVITEFWQGRTSRLHDRIQYTLDEGGEWKIERLAP